MFTGIRYAPTLKRTADKLFVPIAPPNYIYSHFKHVSGTLTPEGQKGVSINKLKMLNTLIEQANHTRKTADKLILPTEAKEETVDALLERYIQTLRSAWTSPALPYQPLMSVPTGLIVNLVA
jgi:hypothetical protein